MLGLLGLCACTSDLSHRLPPHEIGTGRRYTAETGQPYVNIDVLFGTDRSAAKSKSLVSNERGEMRYGIARVSVPMQHVMGVIEPINELARDPARNVRLDSERAVTEDDFALELRRQPDRSQKRDVFIFIHGYNVKFADAVRRAGQLAYDVGFDGVPVAYVWPSRAELAAYLSDADNAEWTLPHLKQFLERVLSVVDAGHVHLIAHSMGVRPLTAALAEYGPDGPRFANVIFAAPDIDADVLAYRMEHIHARARRFTLYASDSDIALKSAESIHGKHPRAGQGIASAPQVEYVNVQHVDHDLLGHSYLTENRRVLDDLFLLLTHDLPASQRNLATVREGERIYWLLRP